MKRVPDWLYLCRTLQLGVICDETERTLGHVKTKALAPVNQWDNNRLILDALDPKDEWRVYAAHLHRPEKDRWEVRPKNELSPPATQDEVLLAVTGGPCVIISPELEWHTTPRTGGCFPSGGDSVGFWDMMLGEGHPFRRIYGGVGANTERSALGLLKANQPILVVEAVEVGTTKAWRVEWKVTEDQGGRLEVVPLLEGELPDPNKRDNRPAFPLVDIGEDDRSILVRNPCFGEPNNNPDYYAEGVENDPNCRSEP